MTNWTKTNLVPLNGLEAWHHNSVGATSLLVPDASGHGRDLTVSAGNEPELQNDLAAINGESAYYFNGTNDPLSWTGPITAKHIFVVMAFEKPEFTSFEGVLSGVASGNILTSENAGNEFFGFGTIDYSYLKNRRVFPLDTRDAPMAGNFAVIEMVLPDGFVLDGIRWGQQLADTSRRLQGWIAESLIYSIEQTDVARCWLYEYFPMRYQIWPEYAENVFFIPFAANKTRTSEQDRENYLSDPYEGPSKALVRGEFASVYELPYALRRQEEFAAIKAFHRQHYPLRKCALRDYRFLPPKDVVGRISSPLREQGSDVTFRFNYSFEFIETPEPIVPDDSITFGGDPITFFGEPIIYTP